MTDLHGYYFPEYRFRIVPTFLFKGLPLSTRIDSLRSRGGPISIPLPKTLKLELPLCLIDPKRKERRGFLGRIEYISRFIAQLTPFREKGFEWKVERPLTFRSILFSTVRNLSILRRLSRGQTQQVTKS